MKTGDASSAAVSEGVRRDAPDPDSVMERPDQTGRAFDLLERYLPEPFRRRIPPADRWWRGRAVLLLWALGYPLELAWSFGMTADAELADELRRWMAQLDDARLIADLEASADVRGDGSHIEFASFDGTAQNPSSEAAEVA